MRHRYLPFRAAYSNMFTGNAGFVTKFFITEREVAVHENGYVQSWVKEMSSHPNHVKT